MSRRTFFLALFVAVPPWSIHAAFVPSKGAGSSRGNNLSRLMATTEADILAAYQQSLQTPVVQEAQKVASSSSTIEVPTEASVVPPVVVENPLSSWWNQITSPLRDMPDPFEKIKIPAELKDVDLNKELANVEKSVKSITVPDIKTLSVPDFKSIDLANIQLPTPPERPEAPGVILPDGTRMQTLFDIYGKPDFSQWKMPSSFTLPAIFESLRFAEFGAWYLAGFLLVAWQVQWQSSQEMYQKKLSEAENMARQAAEAASVAAEGAMLTKELAVTSKKTKRPKSTETILSESQQEALRLEKEEMKRELEMLKKETEALKRQLKATKSAEHAVNGANEPPSVAAKVQPKIVEPMDSETNAQVLEIIKQHDEANAASKAATKSVPKKTEPKKKSVKKTAPKKERVAARKDADVAVMEPIVQVEEEIEVEPIGSDQVYFANMTVVDEDTKPSKGKPTPKKKVQAKKAVEAAPATSDNPWKSLSPSTLKRKTVKDLSAYLTERNVQVTDEAGKPLKKAELLDKVMAL